MLNPARLAGERCTSRRAKEANMRRTTIRAALVAIACALLLAGDPAEAKRRGTERKTTAGVAILAGDLTFAIVGENVRLTALGSGRSSPWGDIVAAEATWSPAVDGALALLAGEVDELTINTGTFDVEFGDGDTITGTLRGTIRPRGDGLFALRADFTATGGTGDFNGVTGGGVLHAIDELATLQFRAVLHAKLNVPR
jgi:hypothetical protein